MPRFVFWRRHCFDTPTNLRDKVAFQKLIASFTLYVVLRHSPTKAMWPLNYTWVPPSLDYLEISNCTEAVQVWGFYKELMQDLFSFNQRSYPGNFELAEGYMRHFLQNYFQKNSLEQPDVVELYHWMVQPEVINYVSIGIEGHCKKDLCPLLGREGNPDIAGIGMLTAYVWQASLTTIYLVALLAIRFKKPQKWLSIPAVSRTLRAAQHSTRNFLNASFVFCTAMLIASIVQLSRVAIGTTSITENTGILSILMPVYSILPVAILQLAASNILRRIRGRLLLWGLVTVLTPALITLHLFVVYRYDYSNEQEMWEYNCSERTGTTDFAAYFVPAVACLVLISLVVYVTKSIMKILRRRPKQTAKTRHRLTRSFCWIGIITAFCTMWISIGLFIQIQKGLGEAAGEKNKDTEWSFGQVLALATWAPVVVEFVYLWWEHPIEALNGRLMAPYEVVEVSRDTETFALLPRSATA